MHKLKELSMISCTKHWSYLHYDMALKAKDGKIQYNAISDLYSAQVANKVQIGSAALDRAISGCKLRGTVVYF